MSLLINLRGNMNLVLSILIYFIPLTIITGPFIPDLLTSLSALLFIIISFKKKLTKYYNNTFVKCFLLFILYIIINSLISNEPIFSLKSSLFYFRFGLLALAIWYLIDNNRNFIRYFFYALSLCFIISIIDGYYQYLFDINLFGISSPGNRLNLLLNDRRSLGIVLSRLFPLLLALYIYLYYHKNSKKYIILLPLMFFIVTDILIFLTGERTAIALLFISALFIILHSNKFKILRLISIFLSILIMIFITIVSPQIKERNIDHTLEQTGFSSNDGNYKFLSNEHHSLAVTALNAFIDKPIVGHGPNMFRKFCNNHKYLYDHRSCSTHPHNIYLQVISELGLVGLMFVVFLVYLVAKISIFQLYYLYFKNDSYISDYQMCLVCSFLLPLIPFLPSLNFFNNWHSIIIFLPLGFLLHGFYKIKDTNNQ